MREIIEEPAYQEALAQEDGFDLKQWLLERWGGIQGLYDTSVFGFYVVVIGLSLVLVALMAHITYTIARALKRRSGPTDAVDRPVAVARSRTPDELIAEADSFAQNRDYRSAIRSLYLAMVRCLQMERILPRTSTQTNGEHVRQLAAHPTLGAVVRPFAGMFDEKWYGGRQATAADVEQCRGWLGTAMQEVEAE